MTLHGFDRESTIFQATTQNELKHVWAQIDLLWQHNRKRAGEIEAIKGRINGTIYSLLVAAVGCILVMLKPKLGF